MLSNAAHGSRWNVLFFGVPCAFSAPIMAALARPDVNLAGVVSPHRVPDSEPFRIVKGLSSRQTISLLGHPPLFAAPRYLVRDIRHPRLAAALAQREPDLIVVACYPRLIPAGIIALARIGAVNVHPSLLPAHRGPEPLFWTFHAGANAAGVTVHSLDVAFDAGDILAQETIEIAPDESLSALELRLANIGAEQIARLITGLPHWPAPVRQDPDRVTHEGFPTNEDRIVDSTWPVTRVRRFVAGVARSHGPLTYRGPGGEQILMRGLATNGDGKEIEFSDGALHIIT